MSSGGSISITDVLDIIDGTTNSYAKYSSLSIPNITFAYNLYQFRVVVSYSGATNTPVTNTTTSVLIDPVINIITQPGVNSMILKPRIAIKLVLLTVVMLECLWLLLLLQELH